MFLQLGFINNLGFNEIALILVLALLLFGPRRLPDLGRTLGRTMAQWRRGYHELRRSFELEVEEADRAELRRERQQALTQKAAVEKGTQATEATEASDATEATEASDATEAPASKAPRPAPQAVVASAGRRPEPAAAEDTTAGDTAGDTTDDTAPDHRNDGG